MSALHCAYGNLILTENIFLPVIKLCPIFLLDLQSGELKLLHTLQESHKKRKFDLSCQWEAFSPGLVQLHPSKSKTSICVSFDFFSQVKVKIVFL